MTVSQYLDLFVVLWLAFWAIKATRSLVAGERVAVNVLILTHFIFCGVPSILNLLISEPIYLLYVSFQKLGEDQVNLIYALYVCACPVIWWRFGRPQSPVLLRSAPNSTGSNFDSFYFRLALRLVAAAPLLLLPFAPNLSFYSSYAAVLSDSVPEDVIRFQVSVSVACTFCVVSIATQWARSKGLLKTILATAPFLFIAFWMNGKRNIVLLAVVLLLFALWERKTLAGWRLLAGATLTFSVFALFSYTYQTGLRSTDLLSAAEQYENVRADYGRDHDIKFAIYCELHPEQTPILEYRGESVLFDFVFFVPRALWLDKPWPYSEYATAAVLQTPMNIGWGITTTWLEEAIANFSWFGLALGPLLLTFVCRLGDHYRTQLTHYLTVVAACLFLAVQLSAFMPLMLAWMVAVLAARRASRKRQSLLLLNQLAPVLS